MITNLGWMMGFEPTTPGITIRCSNQLSYTHQIYRWTKFNKQARSFIATAPTARFSMPVAGAEPGVVCARQDSNLQPPA